LIYLYLESDSGGATELMESDSCKEGKDPRRSGTPNGRGTKKMRSVKVAAKGGVAKRTRSQGMGKEVLGS
jgi:hypothetical protein